MVQNHHVIHTNKKKRNILPRSKLLVQISSLRENNRLLAKAVADKTLKICELENTELSYENLKQQSRESIKSFHEYILKVDTHLRNAASELTRLVTRFSVILSMTDEEKEIVDSLSTLVEEYKYSSSPPSLYTLRDRTITSREMDSKCSESKKVFGTHKNIKRVHPMNLKKTVCILEPVEEGNDTTYETIVSPENECIGGKQARSMTEVNCERKLSRNAMIYRQSNNEMDSEVLNSFCHSKFTEVSEDSDSLNEVSILAKQEVFTPKKEDKESLVLCDMQGPAINTTWSQKIPCITLSPRRLRTRKPINYSEMLNTKYQSGGKKYLRSRTINNTFADKENIRKSTAEITQDKSTNKGNRKQAPMIPLSKLQIKIEPMNSPSRLLETECSGVETTVDGASKMPSRTYDTKIQTSRKQYSRKSIKFSDDFGSRWNYPHSPEHERIDNISSSDKSKMCVKVKNYESSFSEDFASKDITDLRQTDAEDSLHALALKQEVISPKNMSIDVTPLLVGDTFEDISLYTTNNEF